MKGVTVYPLNLGLPVLLLLEGVLIAQEMIYPMVRSAGACINLMMGLREVALFIANCSPRHGAK